MTAAAIGRAIRTDVSVCVGARCVCHAGKYALFSAGISGLTSVDGRRIVPIVDRAERGPTEGEKHPAPSRWDSRPDRISEQPRAPTTARGAKGCDAEPIEVHGSVPTGWRGCACHGREIGKLLHLCPHSLGEGVQQSPGG